jgi:hypothetical protein
MSLVMLLRQHVVALMRPIAFAAAQFNLALHDAALMPLPAISNHDPGRSTQNAEELPSRPRHDVISPEVAA